MTWGQKTARPGLTNRRLYYISIPIDIFIINADAQFNTAFLFRADAWPESSESTAFAHDESVVLENATLIGFVSQNRHYRAFT